jgi:hypothetical protein
MADETTTTANNDVTCTTFANNDDVTTFAPVTEHGALTKVLDNVYIVQGSHHIDGGGMIRIGRTMTIVKSGDNDLTIISSVRVNESTEEEIKKLGTIKHLVRLANGHGVDDAYYVKTFKPTYWSLEGMTTYGTIPQAEKFLSEEEDGGDDDGPIPGMKVIRFKNAVKPEGAIWIPGSGGTLITVDIIQNSVIASEYANFLGKGITYCAGFLGECRCVPKWRMVNGVNHLVEAEKIIAWDFENLISAHGTPKVGGAKALFEASAKNFFKKED